MKVTVPMYITLPRKTKEDKKISLNLNWYRNSYHYESNSIKKIFKEYIREDLEWKTFKEPYGLCFEVFYSRISDLDNWIAVCSKFFNDALVEFGCVTDDNMKYLTEIHATVWGKDTKNPRIEITII